MATVLVVNDRSPDCELLVTLLTQARHRVLEAADGAAALQAVRAEHPDLVIADILPPRQDGCELVRQLRADPAISGTPVIFYTARDNEQEVRDLAREAGAALVLAKPADPEKLLASIAAVLKGKNAGQSLPLTAGLDQADHRLLTDKLLELEQRLEERTAELKKAQEEIRVLHEELETRVRDRIGQLEAANRELEAFSYSVSHDLKAPIRAIDGFSRILTAGYADRLDAEGLRLLKVICTNTRIMGQLIDDLLSLSHLGRKKIKNTVFNLGAMAKQVFNRLKAQGPGRNLKLTVKDLPPAYGDLSLISQVLVNFLANAIKFTKSRETAVIEVGGRIEGTENIYYIKDNGVGFDERYGHHLFGAFQRLHSGGEYEGTGIGLAIVHRVIQRHGGRVWAEGKVNEGATFYFTLPRKGLAESLESLDTAKGEFPE